MKSRIDSLEDRPFYIDNSNACRISYDQLVKNVEAVKSVPCVYAYRNAYELFVTLLAAIRLGTTLVLVDTPSELPAAEAALNECLSSHSINLNPLEEPAQNRLPHPFLPKLWQSESLSGNCKVGLLTSGTTGKPKLVLHTIYSLTRGIRASDKHLKDAWGLAYHPAHIAGLQVFFQALANYNPLVRLYNLPINDVLREIDTEGVTHLSATPTFYNLLCSSGVHFRNVRNVSSGGELSHPQLRDRMANTFPNARIRNIYASTEAGSLLVSSGDQFQVPQVYENRIKVIDGELAIHRSLLASSLQAGWPDEYYRTGDCVEVLNTQPLTVRFISRQGDWINVGGFKVNPHEVEKLLLEMDEVQEAVVYGRDNSVVGSLVCCDIVLVKGAVLTARDLHSRLSPKMPAYMIPRIVRHVSSVHSTRTGKKGRDL